MIEQTVKTTGDLRRVLFEELQKDMGGLGPLYAESVAALAQAIMYSMDVEAKVADSPMSAWALVF